MIYCSLPRLLQITLGSPFNKNSVRHLDDLSKSSLSFNNLQEQDLKPTSRHVVQSSNGLSLRDIPAPFQHLKGLRLNPESQVNTNLLSSQDSKISHFFENIEVQPELLQQPPRIFMEPLALKAKTSAKRTLEFISHFDTEDVENKPRLPQAFPRTINSKTTARSCKQKVKILIKKPLTHKFKRLSIKPLQQRAQNSLESFKKNNTKLVNLAESALNFDKSDRQFTYFWKQKMKVMPGDNRRHIPLVAVMKGMIIGVFDTLDTPKDLKAFEKICDEFILASVAEQPVGHLSSKTKQVLNILTNLRSHIFFGQGHSNQIIGGLADNLLHKEQATLVRFENAKTYKALEAEIALWTAEFTQKLTTSATHCDILIDQDVHGQSRDVLVNRALCQFKEVVSILNRKNFPNFKIFKKEAKCLVKNLRDSYATDISDSRHDKVRQWQNANWLPMHQRMLVLLEQPDLAELSNILSDVLKLEQGFADLVSGILNEQGFETTPAQFMMSSPAFLNSETQAPLREALMDLLQQPS